MTGAVNAHGLAVVLVAVAPGWPAGAVAPPKRPTEVGPAWQFRTWAGHARSHIRLWSTDYADGYAAAWTLHGRRPSR